MRSLAFSLVVGLTSSLFAQGTAADYARADQFGARFANKVLNERLVFGWLPDQGFWFREDQAGEAKQFWLIDGKGKRALVFDHGVVAANLSKLLGRTEAANKLPFSRMSLSKDQLSWIVDTRPRAVAISRKTGDTTFADAATFDGLRAFSPLDVRESEGAGPQTDISFVNQSGVMLRIFWLDEGGQKRPYKDLNPNETWSISTYQGHFWIVTTADGKDLAVYKPTNGATAFLDGKVVPSAPRPARPDPSVSPDGKTRLIFREHQAVAIDVGSKAETKLTTDGTAALRYRGPVIWSPDSRSVAFEYSDDNARRPLNIVQTTPRDQFQPRLQVVDYLKPGDKLANPQVCLWTLGGAVKKVDKASYPQVWDLDQQQWLDADRFVFRYNQRGHQAMRVIEANAKTGAAKVLISEEVPTFIDWTRKTFFQVVDGGRHAIWMSERSGWNHLYRWDLATGQVKNSITSGEWVVREVQNVDDQRREIVFQASGMDAGQDPYELNTFRVNFDGTGLTRLTGWRGNHRIERSPDGKLILDTASAPGMPPTYELRRVADGKLHAKVLESDARPLLNAGFRLPQVFSAKGRDGKTDIWGLVYLPTSFDPAKKYPVIEDIYAGPHGSHVPKGFHTNSGGQQMAELGFIVVRIDGMGTSNRSKAFHDVCWQNIADAGFPDRIAWMRSVATKIPQMDLTRVGIYGTSAGGQNALHALLLFGDFYKVAMADCGCYDNRMDKMWWNEQWMGYPIGPHYEAQSGRTLAPKLQGKLLLMLGENDTNVDPASTWQVVDALVAANKDFDLVVIPNVGHGAVSHPYARRRMRDHFVRHLLGVEPRG